MAGFSAKKDKLWFLPYLIVYLIPSATSNYRIKIIFSAEYGEKIRFGVFLKTFSEEK